MLLYQLIVQLRHLVDSIIKLLYCSLTWLLAMSNPLVSPEAAAGENQANLDAAAFEELIAQESVGGADAADIPMGLLVKGGRHANVTNYELIV